MPRKSKNKDDKEIMSFEEALAKLETIVHELEQGELSLEESLTSFAEGVDLSKNCLEKLNIAEKTIDLMVSQSQEGYTEKPLTFTAD